MSGFECRLQQQADAVVAHLGGTLGAADVAALERDMLAALTTRPGRVVVELSGLAMLGSAGIGALLKLRREVEDTGGAFVLAALPDAIHKILVHSGLNRIFTMAVDLDAALGKPA